MVGLGTIFSIGQVVGKGVITFFSNSGPFMFVCALRAVIVGWYNEEQGNITGFTNYSFTIDIDVPIEANFGGDTITVTTLVIAQQTTWPDGTTQSNLYDLSDEVAGIVVESGDTFSAGIELDVDLSLQKDYAFVITMTGVTDSGQECTGTELLDFTAGVYDFEFNPDGCVNWKE